MGINGKKVMKRFLVLVFLAAFCLSAGAQEVYRTEIFQEKRIKSLQVRQPGVLFSQPVLQLGAAEAIEISFDDLVTHFERYDYEIVHCNADWTPSSLSPIEFMQGFQGLTIDDYANSFNTTVGYVNYRLTLPNEDVQFKCSGNYAVRVYREDAPQETVLTACFSVVEPLVEIQAEVTGNTLVDTYQSHQQVSFEVWKRQLAVAHPASDLKIRVVQNRRTDNVATGAQPSAILSDRIVYENCRDLIFPAGNEYRRFEFLTHRYNGMRIDRIAYYNPYYHADVFVDEPSSMTPYTYDEDQDGRYFPACSRCEEPDTEADYYIVHFTLAMPEAKGGKVYLNGDFVQNGFGEGSEMVYNPEAGQYEKALLLKQGNYNYQYIYLPDGQEEGVTAAIEGDFHQTENEYTIYVYYRPIGARFDRLVGVRTVRSGQETR